MMSDAPQPVRVVVLGGGTAGWMTAAGIAKLLPDLARVQLVESEEIGIVGVGEATLPHIRGFVEKLGIDEAAFMKATHATFKLGIDFRDFGRIGESYIHPFGSFGEEVAGVGFHHYWLELARHGIRVMGIAPGVFATDMTAAMKPEAMARMQQAIPVGALGQGEQLAQTVQFILANDYLSGRIIDLDGGLRL